MKVDLHTETMAVDGPVVVVPTLFYACDTER